MSHRRLSTWERIELAFRAYQCKGIYGAITDLARSYGVSRWLVYHLLNILVPLMLALAEPKTPGRQLHVKELRVDKRHLDRAIVTLRIVGNVPLEGIQRCLEEVLGIYRSIGYISQVIQEAQEQATAFLKQVAYDTTGAGILDELFVGEEPILIAVEPNSTTILMLVKEAHRDGETWGIHLLETQEQGFQFNRVASDQAQGIAAGVQVALGQEIPHQLDIGHLFAQVSQLDVALERAALKSLAYEEERWRVLDSARNERVISKRIQAWEQAHQASEQAILLYDDFHYLAEELYRLFTPIDSDGVPRPLPDVQADLEALMSLIEELPSGRAQQICTRLASQKEGLLVFFFDWEQRLAQLQALIPNEDLLQTLLLEYFLRRKSSTRRARKH